MRKGACNISRRLNQKLQRDKKIIEKFSEIFIKSNTHNYYGLSVHNCEY